MPTVRILPLLTRVDCYNGWWAKRDDLAGYSGSEYPSGSKVRQYAAMAAAMPGATMLVGCSADSAMQIYVAAAARQAGVLGVVYTAARGIRSSATVYALEMGAEVNEIRPGYLSQCRAEARTRGKKLAKSVRWDVAGAVEDAAAQVANLPLDVLRVVVPTGSGLTAAGVLTGLARLRRYPTVVAVAVSGLAVAEKITSLAEAKVGGLRLPLLGLVQAVGRYGDWVAAKLPCGAALDPYYAAKALGYVRLGDCLWIPGIRPMRAMPVDCLASLDCLNPVSPF